MIADAIKRHVEEAYSKVFGSEPVQSISQFIKSKSPFFGASAGKIEAFQERLGQSSVDELKKDISEIEDNMTDNLDVVIESIDQLKTALEKSQAGVQQSFIDHLKEQTTMKLVAVGKWQDLVEEAAKLKTANKQLNEVSKRVVKENLALGKDAKALREKLAEAAKEMSEFKERERRCVLPRILGSQQQVRLF
jgi:DNA repair exonuclease SbcCD ATPase subunit